MIIVEGPDGAGKTTLINKLVEATGLPVAPRVVSKDAEAMVDLKAWVENNVQQGFQPIIFDRHRLISEPIYGPVLRSKPEPGFDDPEWLVNNLWSFYKSVNPLIIYCLPPWSVVWENVMGDEDNRVFHGNVQGFRQIYQGYLTRMSIDLVNYRHAFNFDYTDGDVAPMMFNYLAARIKERTK